LCYGKRRKWYLHSFFHPKLMSRHVILHISTYLCDTYHHSHVSADVATIYIFKDFKKIKKWNKKILGVAQPPIKPVLRADEPPPFGLRVARPPRRAKNFFFFFFFFTSYIFVSFCIRFPTLLISLQSNTLAENYEFANFVLILEFDRFSFRTCKIQENTKIIQNIKL